MTFASAFFNIWPFRNQPHGRPACNALDGAMTDAKTNPAAKPLRIAGQHLAARTDQQSPPHGREGFR